MSAIRWIKEPNASTEAVEGRAVALKWDYDLEGDSFHSLEWIYMKTTETIAERDPSLGRYVNPKFPRFNLSDTENATLIISDVKRTDKEGCSCKLKTRQNRPGIASVVRLNVLCKYSINSRLHQILS